MARIAGVDLPNEKRVEIGITYIYGIGRATANKILKETGINLDTSSSVKSLTLVSGLTPVSFKILLAVCLPIP